VTEHAVLAQRASDVIAMGGAAGDHTQRRPLGGEEVVDDVAGHTRTVPVGSGCNR
jgi:hypothetical protein